MSVRIKRTLTSKHVFYYLICLIILSLSPSVFAKSNKDYAEELIHELLDNTEEHLPDIKQVIPGYKSNLKPSLPGLYIGPFSGGVNDEIDWGLSISELLRQKLFYAPHAIVHSSFLEWAMLKDAGWSPGMQREEVLRDKDSVRFIGKRHRLQYGATGNISIENDNYKISVEIFDIEADRKKNQKVFFGKLNDLNNAINEICRWIYTNVASNLDEGVIEYMESTTPETIEPILDHFKLLTYAWSQEFVRAEQIARKLYSEENISPEIVASYMKVFRGGENVFSHNEFIKLLASDFKDNTYVQLLGAMLHEHGGRVRLLIEELDWIKQIIEEDPDAYRAYIVLAEHLANNGHESEALVVSMEALQKWPDDYVSWWSMAYATMQYAWYFRGTGTYNQVPEKGRRLHQSYLAISNKLINKALNIHPYSVGLLTLKITIIGGINGWSDELHETFLKAVEIDPHNYKPYYAAINYAARKWRGSADKQFDIYELALKNNPGEDWPNSMYKEYVEIDFRNDFYGWMMIKIKQSIKKAKAVTECHDECEQKITQGLIFAGFILVVIVIYLYKWKSDVK